MALSKGRINLTNGRNNRDPVTYKGQELSFKAYVVRFGYVTHVLVDLYGTQVTIETDEEGNYRALVDLEKISDTKVDKELIRAIIGVLESL
jgi:hypothetical protein